MLASCISLCANEVFCISSTQHKQQFAALRTWTWRGPSGSGGGLTSGLLRKNQMWNFSEKPGPGLRRVWGLIVKQLDVQSWMACSADCNPASSLFTHRCCQSVSLLTSDPSCGAFRVFWTVSLLVSVHVFLWLSRRVFPGLIVCFTSCWK